MTAPIIPTSLADALDKLTQATEAATAAAEARAQADKDAADEANKNAQANKEKAQAELTAKQSLQKITAAGKDVVREFMSIVDAGAKLSTTMGITITRGTQLELNNRLSLLGQLRTLDVDRMATMQQIQSAEKSLVDVFGGAREGMELSAAGATEFTKRLQEASGGQFTLTTAAMQAMITAGVGTAEELNKVKVATGLRNMTEQRFAQLVNKNSLSFMLYGPRFAKAAQEAEKLGISLSQVQSAQESMVTNLDGTIDTVAQINQLGGQIDFGTLTRLNEFEGPQATLQYLQRTIPPALFQSASTRALLRGFGISVEDLMKGQQSVQQSAADKIEEQLTRLEQPVGIIADAMATLQRVVQAVSESFGPILKSLVVFGIALLGIGKAKDAFMSNMTKMFPSLGSSSAAAAASTAANMSRFQAAMSVFKKIGPLAALASGIGGFVSAKQAGEDTTTAAATGTARATMTLAGAFAGSFFGPVGTILGSMLGDFLSRFIPQSLIDMLAGTFSRIGASFGGFVDSMKELWSAVSGLVSAIMGLVEKGKPFFEIIATAVAGPLIGLLTFIGEMVNLLLKLTALGATKTAGFINWITGTGDDVVSRPGYGERTLVTPGGAIALNNRDNVVAYADDMVSGIRTLSLGSIARSAQPASDPTLVAKINELITVLQSSNTTINIDNKIQQVPRMVMAGVYSRNERV